jgi:DNA polymerase I
VVPFDYQSTILRGAAAKIDALLLREYLHRRRAVPLPGPAAPVGGAHVAIFQQGVARPALHVDVTSLYPSLMLSRGIGPTADELEIFGQLLAGLTAFRINAKRRARETTDPSERAHWQALQQSFKLLINAFYGYLAFAPGHWNDFDAANRVTAEGREVVRAIIDRLVAMGAVPLEADTDGVYFMPPPGHSGADEALLERIAQDLPEGIQLELDGHYAAMFSYKLKTYALLDGQGRLSLRGSAFRSRGLEPFQRRLIEEIVGLLLTRRGPDVKAAVDQISYYVAGRGAGVTVNESAKLVAAWNPERPDENAEYYQAKVLEIWERFRPFVDNDSLRPPTEETEGSPQLSLFP